MILIRIILSGFIVLAMTNCEPTKNLFVINPTNETMELTVKCDSNEYFDISRIEGVYYSDSTVMDPKWNVDFNSKLPIQKLNNEDYKLSIPSRSTTLLEPRWQLSIKEVVCNNDTLRIFPISGRNFKYYRELNRLKRKINIFYSADNLMFYLN